MLTSLVVNSQVDGTNAIINDLYFKTMCIGGLYAAKIHKTIIWCFLGSDVSLFFDLFFSFALQAGIPSIEELIVKAGKLNSSLK